MESETEKTEYKGNCHCGAFKFKTKLSSPGLGAIKVRNCDCSVCSKNAPLWIFPVADADFEIQSGKDSLQAYKFGSELIPNYFCPKCGSTVLCRINMENIPKDRSLGINARMLRDIDLDKLELVKMTGSEFGEQYQPPTFPPIEETEKKLGKNEGDGMKVYHGNCHCKAVTFSVLTKPLEEQEIMSCNCSSCSRNGDLFIYPKKNQVVIHTGKPQITPYAFISKDSLHSFCKVCGVSIMVEVLSEDDVCPLNVRTLVDFPELETAGKLKRTYYDGAKMDPQYKV